MGTGPLLAGGQEAAWPGEAQGRVGEKMLGRSAATPYLMLLLGDIVRTQGKHGFPGPHVQGGLVLAEQQHRVVEDARLAKLLQLHLWGGKRASDAPSPDTARVPSRLDAGAPPCRRGCGRPHSPRRPLPEAARARGRHSDPLDCPSTAHPARPRATVLDQCCGPASRPAPPSGLPKPAL